jgi:hypothetical protein
VGLVGVLEGVGGLVGGVAALELALLREIDGRGVALEQGASSTVAWLRDRYRLSGSRASGQVRFAATMHELAETGAALAAGTVNAEQAGVIAAAVSDLPARLRVAGQEYLIEQAAVFGPRELGRLGQRLLEVIAPQVAARQAWEQLNRDEQRAHAQCDLRLVDEPGSARVRLVGRLDQEAAAVVRAALEPLCAPRPSGNDGDTRSPGQRRADALVEVCRLALARDELPDHGGQRPQIVVTIDLETLRTGIGTATLDDGSLLSAATARRLACDAQILPAVLNGRGQILDLGRERRLFTGPLRRALVLRDGGCAFPGCDRPPRWCEGHHIIGWLHGGTTDLTNAVLLCGHHHRLVHHSDWHVHIDPHTHRPTFIPPAYIDPQRRPRQHLPPPQTTTTRATTTRTTTTRATTTRATTARTTTAARAIVDTCG